MSPLLVLKGDEDEIVAYGIQVTGDEDWLLALPDGSVVQVNSMTGEYDEVYDTMSFESNDCSGDANIRWPGLLVMKRIYKGSNGSFFQAKASVQTTITRGSSLNGSGNCYASTGSTTGFMLEAYTDSVPDFTQYAPLMLQVE